MALIPKDRYPGQTITTDPNYPLGKARNVTVPRDGTGTPWEADLTNDWFGFFQALLNAAAITPSGTPDHAASSQYLDAIRRFASQGVIVTDAFGGTLFGSYGASLSGWAYARHVMINCTGNAIISGLDASGLICRQKTLWNVGTHTINIENNGSGTAPVLFPFYESGVVLGELSYPLRPGASIEVIWDSANAVWRAMAQAPVTPLVRRIGINRFRSHDVGTSLISAGELIMEGGNTRYGADITESLPPGATILSVQARVTPGAVRAGTSRVALELRLRGAFGGTTGVGGESVIGGTVYDNGTTNTQVLTASIGAFVEPDSQYTLCVKCGSNAVSANDYLHAVQVAIQYY